MQYGQKNKLVNQGPIFVYSLPEKNAYGLANYNEKAKIKYEEDCRQMNKSLRRFASGGIARTPKRFPPSRALSDG